MSTIPITLLTGFLGSGKTTLVNALLADRRMRDTAVIVNEFGSVSVDHDLIRRGSEQYILNSSGCLCCAASSDIRASLYELHEDRRQGEIPAFRRVIIETTGLADPAPIVNSLIPGGAPAIALRDHVVARAFRLSRVVAAFDVQNGEETLGDHFECWKQLAFADQIVLTKTDLASAAGWHHRLGEINPTASVIDGNAAGFDPVALIGASTYSAGDKPEDVLGWLAMENLAEPLAEHPVHHPNRHGPAIEAMPLYHDEPLDPAAVDAFLEVLTSQPHTGLLRLKGLFALADDPSRPLVAHAVQHRLYPTHRLDYWPSMDVRSRVMVIGDNMPLKPIRELFQSLRPRTARRRAVGA
ncbi:CobW family GTP-binding protein [Ancylobacter mangrovi]|uniref:CobW family GTP-binding protein n=1 Tax=Ancylobacter mangrovi TaxID=2972472 RepID=UPI00216334C6|nr:GTP-binding protein [Ancylobacter mangrovi]MCS0504750.1 GTP-binding protein [Ancylobacter mangrovi]